MKGRGEQAIHARKEAANQFGAAREANERPSPRLSLVCYEPLQRTNSTPSTACGATSMVLVVRSGP